MIQPWLEACSKDLFFTKNDKIDLRLGDLVKTLESFSQLSITHISKSAPGNSTSSTNSRGSASSPFVILGYPDDEGIKLNGGRVGAAQAPEAIRRVLYKMTPSLRGAHVPLIFDGGDLSLTAPLSERHQQARKTVESLLETNANVITMGGGHDYGFSDMAAFCKYTLSLGQRPFVVNFDAHLDVRPDDKGENSGTPFYRLLNEFSGHIDFYEVGIQDWCNSRSHLEWAQARGAHIITLESLNNSPGDFAEALSYNIFRHVKPSHRVALSVDIDCFSSSSCPGASQVFPTGFTANEFLKAWQPLVAIHRPQLTSFYEVSPPLDLDQRTSRMAALLIHQRLFAN